MADSLWLLFKLVLSLTMVYVGWDTVKEHYAILKKLMADAERSEQDRST